MLPHKWVRMIADYVCAFSLVTPPPFVGWSDGGSEENFYTLVQNSSEERFYKGNRTEKTGFIKKAGL